jgi:fructosamine-3-kinase
VHFANRTGVARSTSKPSALSARLLWLPLNEAARDDQLCSADLDGRVVVARVNSEILALLVSPAAQVTKRKTVLSDGRRVFVKHRADVPADFFAAEARGLAVLAQSATTLRVPAVFAVAAQGIVIEDLGSGRPSLRDWESAGCGLAQLHAVPGVAFGFDADGYCGDSAQDNTNDGDGFRFFAERRLLPQARRAVDRGLLDQADAQRIETLCARLPALLPAARPVLIHGDLWSGNLHVCANGELALIDGGAVHNGWADCDLAMLMLFGEPPRVFFDAYEGAAGIDSAWRRRAPLLNLYHLLNHLNLFGSGYLGGVRAVLARYT